MLTNATGYPGITGWTGMPTTADHSADVISYPIGWTWTGAPTAIVGTSNATGTGVFGFTVFKNVAGPQVIALDANASFSFKVRYRVVIDNPTTITNHTLPRLALELYCLGYNASAPLPKIGSKMFDGSFGTITGASNLVYPTVRGWQADPESESDPAIWIITYTVSPQQTVGAASRPSPGAKATKPNSEEAPWTIGPDVVIQFGTEDFVLGLGKFLGATTPAAMGAAIEAGTYAAAFGETGGTFEMVSNSAGDPLESPPPMKIGMATISINRAFETLPSTIKADLNAAVEEVCSAAVTANEISFAAYTCKLNAGTVANKRWKKQCDWLPKQLHPLDWTYTQVGWTPPTGATAGAVAINYTRNALPAFEYIDYFDVSVSIAQRDLGWGYALIDKGYRHLENGEQKENFDFAGRQVYVKILAEGAIADTSTGTTDKNVLRLYQVLKTGTHLSTVLETMLGETGGTA